MKSVLRPALRKRPLAAFLAALPLCVGGAAAAQDQPEEAEAQAQCVESFDVKRTRPGAAEIRVSSSCRKAGDSVVLTIDGYAFSADFDAQGQANAVLPLFGRLTLLNWQDAEGGPRAELIEFPGYDSSIQIALVWSGEAALRLFLRESPAPQFTGETSEDPAGNIGPDHPNLDLAQGFGRLILADAGGTPGHHAQVYVLEAADNPVLRGLRERARIEPRIEVALDDEDRLEACRALAESGIRTHFTLHVSFYGLGRTERQALGESACDPEAPSGRRLIRMDPVDFSAEK